MQAYDALMAYQRETEALNQVAQRLGWDQETMMPRGAAGQRAEEIGALEAVLHARKTAPELGEWLHEIDDTQLDEVARAQVRHIRRSFARASKVPAALASRIAQVTSVAFGTWATARENEDVAAFLPTLQEIIALRREEGEHVANGGDAYSALLDEYEAGTSGAEVAALFDGLRPGLVGLREAVLERPAPAALSGHFSEAAQLTLARSLAEIFGYDMSRGRIDRSVHPFSSGGGHDVRITTRVNEADPLNCLYSTLHEVGHASYEQGIDPDYALTPLGQSVSLGVHESQSRIFENQLGRSEAFCHYLYARMRDSFGEIGVANEHDLYCAVNRVHRGYIRTESDEIQYNLHIMQRFDLERSMIAGELRVEDLEDAWNSRFEADFGYPVNKPSNGVLQDVHWAAGLVGYFPTYTLGNVYAGCLHAAMRRDLRDLDDQLAQGDLSSPLAWLRERIHRHGGRYLPREIIARATSAEVSDEPLLRYLDTKFRAIYAI